MLVKTKTEEQHKNTDLLTKLDALKLLHPNVKLSEAVSDVVTPEKVEPVAPEAPKVIDEDNDDVEIVSVQKKGIEVICLDDDDD